MMQKETTYSYYMLSFPNSLSKMPKGLIAMSIRKRGRYIPEIRRYAYGVMVLDRPLNSEARHLYNLMLRDVMKKLI